MELSTFADLALRSELVDVLSGLGYEEPTPIQREAIPPLLEGRDLIGQAATGTGKTAAFALPLLNRLAEGDRGKTPSALVLAPTRELAVQVAEAVTRYGATIGARVLAVYGGQPITPQLKALQKGVDIVVGTPGRVVDHLNRGSLKLTDLKVVVLDEADEMFDMGFADEIEAILAALPLERQTVLFSATMPPKIARMARKHQKNAVQIQVEREKAVAGEAPKVTQTGHLVMRHDKPAALARILDMHQPPSAIVFCRTREEVDELSEGLKARGYRAEPLHGGMSQEQRDRVMNRLRNQTADLLIATDVAARGLDVDHLTHVVNYNVPPAPESYVHRIGRVGRAGREGVAITLAEPRERRMLEAIERLTGTKIALSPVPTRADLLASRLEVTRTALVDVLDSGQFEGVQAMVDTLVAAHGADKVALAAAALAHRAAAPADEADIPEVSARPPRPVRDDAPRTYAPKTYATAGEPRSRGGAHQRTGPPERKPAREGWAKLYVGAGRAANVRPQDLVGAIAGESHLTGKQIGSIEITERFSLVEVPEGDIDEVIKALRSSVIKGRKAIIRRDRDA
ncbi:MAG: heavy metal transporter [Frankiales bacterium]|nr:heavy metal transporter [Frankiales bacterium]